MRAYVIKQAGGIVYRVDPDGPRVLLVRARKNPAHWIFPKGHLQSGESSASAALREVAEEAGITGRVVRTLKPPLTFKSGQEPVSVDYYVINATGAAGCAERETQWLPLRHALETLTHRDARKLLLDAWPEIKEEAQFREPPPPADADNAFTQLVLAEYEHAANSLLQNEADGEKRATFFLTLSGAAAAALGLLVGESVVLDTQTVNPVVVSGLAIVLGFGHLTFVRVLNRNLASDRYKRSLNRLRRHFLNGAEDARRFSVGFDPYVCEARKLPSWYSLGRGGWLETIAAVESVVAGAFVAALTPTPRWRWEVLLAGIAGFVAWLLLILDARRRLRSSLGDLA